MVSSEKQVFLVILSSEMKGKINGDKVREVPGKKTSQDETDDAKSSIPVIQERENPPSDNGNVTTPQKYPFRLIF